MAVNSFVKDSEHPSPLIRALAIRTMGCIRVEKIVEYLAPPLKRALQDEDPYVRKTAALAVAKLNDISPVVVRQQGFLDSLRDLLGDANPTVVANAVAALTEIQEATGKEVFEISGAVLQKLLAAINECTEWGQVFILDSLARYTPSDSREAENIIDRVTPRLVHQNVAVVLSAVKIIMIYMDGIQSAENIANFCRKLAPPLITLAQASQPEVQYVALRNINIIVQKRPNLLSHKIKVFFCKYNDPIYVKMEKLDILVKLVNANNVDSVLLELREYAAEVDIEYVRRAVRTIGRCAIKLEVAAEKCIKVLLQLITTKVNYVVQEAVVVIKDIFRRYPNRYESIIGVLCSCLDTLDEPEAKASMIWIIGEYADRIDNAAELLQTFLDSFHDETTTVQLQLLTATVKLFLKNPTDSEALVQAVLSAATEHSDNPDLRDRGYIYWRLLSSDPDAAKAVVLADRPVIQDDTNSLDPVLLDTLIRNISTLASVYHKPPESFIRRARPAGAFTEDEEEEEDEGDMYDEGEATGPGASVEARGAASNDDDLLGLGGGAPAPVASSAGGGGGGLDDLFGFGGGAPSRPAAQAQVAVPSYPVLGEKDGLVVHGAFVRRNGSPALDLVVDNSNSAVPVGATALKFNSNSLGLSPNSPNVVFTPSVNSGASGYVSVPVVFNSALVGGANSGIVQAAMRDNGSGRVVFFNIPLAYEAFFSEDGESFDRSEFVSQWKSLSGDKEVAEVAKSVASTDPAVVQQKLKAKNLFFMAQRPGPDPSLTLAYFVARALDSAGSSSGAVVLVELTFKAGLNAIKVVVKSPNGDPITKLGIAAVKSALA
jgi:AP-1 complex subunit beta-1